MELVHHPGDVVEAVGPGLHEQQHLAVVVDRAVPFVDAADRDALHARRQPLLDQAVADGARLVVRPTRDLDLAVLTHRPSVARRGARSLRRRRTVDADGVVAAGRPWSALPGAEALDAFEPGVASGGVVGVDPERPAELEPGDQVSAGRDVAGHVGDDGRLGPRLDEDHHVARHDDDVERRPTSTVARSASIHSSCRCLQAGVLDHRRVEVDADDVDAARRQLDRHPTRAAAGVEHGRRLEPADEVGLAVDRLARRGEGAPSRVVVVAGGEPFVGLPTRPHTARTYCGVTGPNRVRPCADPSSIWHPGMVTDISNSFEGDEPLTIIGISFGDVFRSQEFLTAMTRMSANGELRLKDAVIVAKNDDGTTVVRETVDLQAGRTALSGAVWTGLLGLLVGGPVGWLAGLGIGAASGAITAKVVDLGVPDEWVEWFREAVAPETFTVVILAEAVDVEALIAEAMRFKGHLVHANMAPDAIRRLEHALGDVTHDPAPLPGDNWAPPSAD